MKLGTLEIEYEGNEAFLKGELLNLVNALADHHSTHANQHTEAAPAATHSHTPPKGNAVGTTGSFAHKLGVKTGPDLVIAAAAHLALVKGKEKFSRKELLSEMRSASNFFKESHMKNMGGSLKNLQNANKLLEPSKGDYALSAEELARVKALLA